MSSVTLNGEEWLTALEYAAFRGIPLEEFGKMLLDPRLRGLANEDGLFPLSKLDEYFDGALW